PMTPAAVSTGELISPRTPDLPLAVVPRTPSVAWLKPRTPGTCCAVPHTPFWNCCPSPWTPAPEPSPWCTPSTASPSPRDVKPSTAVPEFVCARSPCPRFDRDVLRTSNSGIGALATPRNGSVRPPPPALHSAYGTARISCRGVSSTNAASLGPFTSTCSQ